MEIAKESIKINEFDKKYNEFMQYYSDFISRCSPTGIMELLTSLENEEEKLRTFVLNNEDDERACKHYDEISEKLKIVRLLLNKKKALLEIKENQAGNEDIKLLNILHYHI